MKTAQEWFNEVAPLLLKQGKQSGTYVPTPNGERWSCTYRGNNGLKCAVGLAIPDELYNGDIEGMGASDFWTHGTSQCMKIADHLSIDKFGRDDTMRFWDHLQEIHDHDPPHDWQSMLESFADKWNLSPGVIQS